MIGHLDEKTSVCSLRCDYEPLVKELSADMMCSSIKICDISFLGSGGLYMSITFGHLRVLARLCVGRGNDYALQRADGLYTRMFQPLSMEVLRFHLAGVHTVGSYVIDEWGSCRFAVFDADSEAELLQLLDVQSHLARDGVASYLEGSRRGGHLRVFLDSPVEPARLRRWLLPYCPRGIEFYPKQDGADWQHPGSLVRLPLGVHQLSGRRYPFVSLVDDQLEPVARSLSGVLTWLSTVEQVQVPDLEAREDVSTAWALSTKKNTLQKSVPVVRPDRKMTIREWCLQQDAPWVIGRYVALDERGMGCCPFGWHHRDGQDSRSSLWVYRPRGADLCCWYCHAWQQGGSLFDFLRYYYGLDARALWRRILSGEDF